MAILVIKIALKKKTNTKNTSLPRWLNGKESACSEGDVDSVPGLARISFSWRKKWQHTPVFLPRKSHGQRSLLDHGITESCT